MTDDFETLLRALTRSEVRFVVIGGTAVVLHGSSYLTADIDLAVERSRDNARRIVEALAPFRPRLRSWPSDVPFRFDAQTVVSAEILTLETDIGDVDLFGDVRGVGSF